MTELKANKQYHSKMKFKICNKIYNNPSISQFKIFPIDVKILDSLSAENITYCKNDLIYYFNTQVLHVKWQQRDLNDCVCKMATK